MKNNNYKQLARSPSEPSILKRSASHALRSSFRLPKKRMNNTQFHALNLEQLPSYIPPKAAAILEIKVSTNYEKLLNEAHSGKYATIRKRSVWANSSASKNSHICWLSHFKQF